jgi:hypothetical protein
MNNCNNHKNSSNNDKNTSNNYNKNKIIISNSDIITNGSTDQYSLIQNINEIGTIVDINNTIISEITPLIMILNQNSKECQNKLNAMIDNGADLNMKINYFGKNTSAMDIINNYRKNLII